VNIQAVYTQTYNKVRVSLMLLMLFVFNTQADETRILVLESHDSPPYQHTLEGFQERMNNSRLKPRYHIISLANKDSQAGIPAYLKNASPQLIFTLGTPATKMAVAQSETVPVVAALIFDACELKHSGNVTAVMLVHAADTQWRYLRRQLPDASHIAVMYNPEVSQTTFQSIQKLARRDNILLNAIPIKTTKELALAIRHLSPQLDAFWILDASVFNNAAIRQLLLFSFRNRIPLIGLSAPWVKAGALYALDWDYYDMGEQAADLALKILQQKQKPSSLSPLHPRTIRPVYNPKTADYMKLKLDTHTSPPMVEVSP